MRIDPSELTIVSALQYLHSGEFSACDLVNACLENIEQQDPGINAVITPTPDLAHAQADQADLLLKHRPSNLDDLALLGIPLLVKDLIDVAGVPTTAGSRFFGQAPAVEDAPVVLRLKLAGACLLGKSNTHEIALGVTGVNPHFGAVRNPRDPARITGGSSSGSAAGVAAGMCLAALGTDTGGSIRIPASLCGVVGLKPTYGRISTRGVLPLSWNLDHVGVLTRSVEDAALLLQVLGGYDPHDPTTQEQAVDVFPMETGYSLDGWRIALAVGEYFEICEPAILDGVQSAARVFKQDGAQVEMVNLDWIAPLAQANSRMTQADGAAFHRDRLATHPDWFGEDVRQRLESGTALSSTDYALARRAQVEGRRQFEQFFSKFDLLVLPTMPITAPLIEEAQAIEAARNFTRFTSPFNLAGLPALSVPGKKTTGLPYGIQLVSGHWQETRLFQAGACLQKHWH